MVNVLLGEVRVFLAKPLPHTKPTDACWHAVLAKSLPRKWVPSSELNYDVYTQIWSQHVCHRPWKEILSQANFKPCLV